MTDTDPWNPANLLPLSVLTAEGFGNGSVDTLADKLGDAVIIDDVGIRCATRATARRLFAERAAAQAEAQARDAARRAELAAKGNPVRDRVRALQQQQEDPGGRAALYDGMYRDIHGGCR